MIEIPFARPYLSGRESEAVAEVIASGWISQGPRVQEFEAAFARRVGAADAVATTSCTTALHLALHGAGVRPGDEVIVPSLSFIATANAVWMCGARPVFADIDPRTCNLDPQAVERAITPCTKAIMPVHQVGLPCDMDAMLQIAAAHELAIVQDAACAIGATYKGRQVGSIGPVSCFSLHPRKVITTGEGGMIALTDPDAGQRLRALRQHAMSISDLARHSTSEVVLESYPERGFNYRMTDMQAALGLSQLEALEHVLERRRLLAERYSSALAEIPHLQTPWEPPYAMRTWQSYSVRLSPQAPFGRNELMRLLLADGIPTRRGVMAIHLERAYCDPAVRLPHTEAAARQMLMLPLFADLTFEQQDRVIERLAAHLGAKAAQWTAS
jgi:dTDP-4-amino-4,6-dideoxygalactose transaminase